MTRKIKPPRIKVKNSGIFPLQFHNDSPDGNLIIAEAQKNIPFKIKRVYFINHLFNKIAQRGRHAHKKLEQIILCLNGSFRLELDDGRNRQKILMNNPYYGVRLGSRLWHRMSGFSPDCVIMVLASDYYKESDYIRDYEEFKKYLKK
ncbi:MAG: FdtA/QdtA family cupin domain-containing protein [Patescibacteria group bacterium]